MIRDGVNLRATASRERGTGPVLVAVFLDTLGLGLILPVAPRLIASFLHDDPSAAAHDLGMLFALYAVMQFLFAPLLGSLSDRFGRRPVLLSSLLGAGASHVLCGFAPSLSWMFVGRIVSGITGASYSAASAYVADVTPPEKRAQSFGLVGAVFGLGFILGPALGGILGDFGLRVPYFAAAALNFVNLSYGLFVLPESLAHANRRPISLLRANPLGSLRLLGRHPAVLGWSSTLVCSFLAQTILWSVWALHAQTRFGWTVGQVGGSLAVLGVAAALVQGLLVRAIVPRIGEKRTLIAGLGMAVAAYAGLGFADRGGTMVAFIVPLALSGVGSPAAQALISKSVGASDQGQLQGSLTSLNGLASIVGPLLGTGLFARFGAENASPRLPGAAFFAAAALSALGLAFAIPKYRH